MICEWYLCVAVCFVCSLSGLSNVHVARSFAQVIQLLSSCQQSGKLEQAFVIGGESVYQACNVEHSI